MRFTLRFFKIELENRDSYKHNGIGPYCYKPCYCKTCRFNAGYGIGIMFHWFGITLTLATPYVIERQNACDY